MSETPIAELMARDPISLSDQDIDAIITDLRSKRKRFVLGDAKAGSMKAPTAKAAAATAKEKAALDAAGNIDLDDLGI